MPRKTNRFAVTPGARSLVRTVTRAPAKLSGQKSVPQDARRFARFCWSRSGAAASEFALVLPFLILCLFGISAFASTLFVQNNMVNAAREAVRDIAVLHTPITGGSVQCSSALAGTAEKVACDNLTFWGGNFTIAATTTCPATPPSATVSINLNASDAALIDIFGFFNGKNLNASVTMRMWNNCPLPPPPPPTS